MNSREARLARREYLDHADEQDAAWELAKMYADLAQRHCMPLAIGVRHMPNVGGFEVYAELVPTCE
jgi:hypothetical protein